MSGFQDRIYPALPVFAQNLSCTWAGFSARARASARTSATRSPSWSAAPTRRSRRCSRSSAAPRPARCGARASTSPTTATSRRPPTHRDPREAIRRTLAAIPPLDKRSYRDEPRAFLARDVPRQQPAPRPHQRHDRNGAAAVVHAARRWPRSTPPCGGCAGAAASSSARRTPPSPARRSCPWRRREPPFWRTNAWGAPDALLDLPHDAGEPARLRRRACTARPRATCRATRRRSTWWRARCSRPGARCRRAASRAVFTSSESLLAFHREAIEAAFGAPVRDRYGVSEFGVSMTECDARRLHVDMEFCIVEVEVEEETRGMGARAAARHRPRRPTRRRCLRYRIGDVGTRAKQPCPCGRPGESSSTVDGRIEDYVADAGRPAASAAWTTSSRSSSTSPRRRSSRRRRDAIEVRIVPRAGLERGRASAAMMKEIRSRLGDEIDVQIELVNAIAREPNGKFRAVKSAVGRNCRMTASGLARTQPSYRGLAPPFGPGKPLSRARRLAPGRRRSPRTTSTRRCARRCTRSGSTPRASARRSGTRSASSWPRGAARRAASRTSSGTGIRRRTRASSRSSRTERSLRAVLDYALLAAGPEGSVAVAEAPQHDCDFERDPAHRRARRDGRLLRQGARLRARDDRPAPRGGRLPRRRDRRAAARCPAIRAATALVDLGERSAFHGSGLDPQRFRGADYDPGATTDHHVGRSPRVPALRDRALRRSRGEPPEAQDAQEDGRHARAEEPGRDQRRQELAAAPLRRLARPRAATSSRAAPGSTACAAARPRSRACCWRGRRRGLSARRAQASRTRPAATASCERQLARQPHHLADVPGSEPLPLLLDARGPPLDAPAPVRRALHVIDGIVAGEGEGPLAPHDRPLGAIVAATDPLALDLACVRLMGFDERASRCCARRWRPAASGSATCARPKT